MTTTPNPDTPDTTTKDATARERMKPVVLVAGAVMSVGFLLLMGPAIEDYAAGPDDDLATLEDNPDANRVKTAQMTTMVMMAVLVLLMGVELVIGLRGLFRGNQEAEQ